jgi:CheY-like chemotaxis protein
MLPTVVEFRLQCGQKADMLMSEQFTSQLRSDLKHLYDPDLLRSSPLATLFGVANRFDTPSCLRRILTEAIESLEPGDDELSQAPTWLIYEPLFYRYVQRLSQQEIADQLGICTRHVRRKERAALKVLADRLWQQFHLQTKLEEDSGAASIPEQAETSGSDVNRELAWLRDVPPDIATDLDQVLPTVMERVRPLAVRYGTRLDVALGDSLPNLVTYPVAFTQTLLNLLGVAIHCSPEGSVNVAARSLGAQVEIELQCTRSASRPECVSNDDLASLEMAQQLTELSGGRLTVWRGGDERLFSATLTLPACAQVPVLAIDDNVDTLRLLQHYVSDTRYHVIGAQDPGRAVDLAVRHFPHAIVLDVMMPQVDGWEVLARLRQHPRTGHIPIVVCTILVQEELALSLGAHAFLHKPVTRQAFLAALDRVTPMASASR